MGMMCASVSDEQSYLNICSVIVSGTNVVFKVPTQVSQQYI